MDAEPGLLSSWCSGEFSRAEFHKALDMAQEASGKIFDFYRTAVRQKLTRTFDVAKFVVRQF